MSTWWSYRPADFLLFSEEVYWRLFELQNAALWPAQIVALAGGTLILVLALRQRPWSGPIAGVLLAAAWVSVTALFLWQRYQPINWAALYAIPPFLAEAAILLFAFARRESAFAGSRGLRSALGAGLFVYALALHPLLPLATGRPLGQGEIFALAPDPTAIATLGILLLARRRPLISLALPVPLVWCLASWATLQTIGTFEAWIPFAAALIAIIGAFLSERRRKR
ncbi:DUF6064 family protein [Afifella sp. JA880]|uniref:DUF6064 family protein n=1 Tax=Afifella sp. JA880 TaxID=2975280 RepID=UPI0021BAF83D|nr:DUF6064 family protein [Afifella sp. JA880]MCT8269044.1 DUF6064 family protein [Afifella sp. JA880]